MKDIGAWIGIFVTCVVLVGLFIATLDSCSDAGARKACDRLERATGKRTKFEEHNCYVNLRGEWVPREAWRAE